MSKDIEKEAYRDWFNSTFTTDEKEVLLSIGIECDADHPFFKYEILNIGASIGSYKLKNIPDLYEKFIDRYIALVPRFLHAKIDRTLLRDGKYYAAWFANRHCFLDKQRQAKDSALSQDRRKREYLLWSPNSDIYCPQECLQFKDTIYHVLDDEFIEHSVNHWMTIRQGCRCALITLTEDGVKKQIAENKGILSPSLKLKFAREIDQAKTNMKTFNQIAYDLVFGKFPYYHLYNPENLISDDDENSHIKDWCLRELQIIVESLDIVKNTQYVDTAQSRLDLARSKLDVIRQQNRIFDKNTFGAITAKLIIEFRKAHTCVYTNLFNAHIEKSKTVKRQTTKDKYLNLAREAVEIGLTDQFADESELIKLLNRLDNKN